MNESGIQAQEHQEYLYFRAYEVLRDLYGEKVTSDYGIFCTRLNQLVNNDLLKKVTDGK